MGAGEGNRLQQKQSHRDADLRAELDARFRAALMSYFLRRVSNRAEAEDLTQEVFVRLIGSDSFADIDRVEAFVFRIASNLLRDRSRKGKRWRWHQKSPLDEDAIGEFVKELVEDRGPERVLMGKKTLVEVMSALDELGGQTRDIFLLFRLEAMKQHEIAALHGISTSTVEKHVMRAAHHLAQRFRPKAP
jgi:RNA polymerase sigma factor (sigma-70 family)